MENVARASLPSSEVEKAKPSSRIENSLSAISAMLAKTEADLTYICEVVLPLVLLVPPQRIHEITDTTPDNTIGFPPYHPPPKQG